VTYFFNGGEEKLFPGEEKLLIPSPKEVATYDLKPQMSAFEVTEALINKIKQSAYDFYTVNFANCDMVGHTGNYQATIKAVETIDDCIKKLADLCLEKNIALVITADHGNADQMLYPDGSPQTSHSDAPVPFVIVHPKLKNQKFSLGSSSELALKDVAPTILSLMGLRPSPLFVGKAVDL
jgi:2,3-bisphosphoglycerate-independent phosphoglycerate mutase